ncbi:DUF1800 domain-containing protein [Novipirellula artificiosorum]|uniref:DUF1800 domain-containing protein n=1 Tax=Novipirellula artificiosorum TaxID=2528016 RepID=A0A5C6DK93_9BACT|nr:DUF1800 domain-containing protein [Novipirellula artificiosorum]TWU37168.1 hypothetical protein Poly41_32950 [Novipirellula artificiosorum]
MTEVQANRVDPDWAWQPFEPTAQRPWDRRLAAHLYRRAGFGADLATLDEALLRTPAEVVDELLQANREPIPFQVTADSLAQTILASGDPKRLSSAWVYRLLFTPSQLLEKTTLFWHGHFATSADKVTDATLMWQQNQLLRSYALGRFDEMVEAIAQDPAMLIYLDSTANRKAHPNENFARELMELFCLGEGNFREGDVRELARCFTGWEIKNNRFRKNRYQQDTGPKSLFSRTGPFDGEEAIAIVTEQPSLERFLARKWYRFFVSDEPQPSAELLQPLADCFRASGLQVAAPLTMLLKSNLFFSEHAIGRKIKSPVEFVVGTLRCLNATTNTNRVADGLRTIGQGLFYPPNVKGWDGGRTWINSSTLIGRANLMADLLGDSVTRFDGKPVSEYFRSLGVRTTSEAIEHLEQCLLVTPLSEQTKSELRSSVELQSTQDEQGMRSLLLTVTSLPQCQIG